MHAAEGLDRALQGVIPPLITPLTPGGELDEPALLRQIHRCLEAGCSGIFVNGSSGEGPWLTAAQRRRSVELASTTGTAVLAGTMLPGTSMTREAAVDAQAAGADAVVVSAPYYFAADDDSIVRHVQGVMDHVQVPGLLYNIPQLTHNPITADAVARLSIDVRVVGIKDSSGDMGLFRKHLLSRAGGTFRVLQGAEGEMAESLRAGADGLVPGLANVAPQVFVGLRQAIAANDQESAAAYEQTIAGLRTIYTVAPTFAAMKAACEVLGVCERTPAAPLRPATEVQVARIGEILSQLRLDAVVP